MTEASQLKQIPRVAPRFWWWPPDRAEAEMTQLALRYHPWRELVRDPETAKRVRLAAGINFWGTKKPRLFDRG